MIQQSGPFGLALLVLGAVVALLTVRGLMAQFVGGPESDRQVRDLSNAVLFWGVAAAALGALGQCQGTYLALGAIRAAPELDPRVIAEGFVITFYPSLMGLAIMGFAVVAWLGFRSLGRTLRTTPLLLVALAVPGSMSCHAQAGPPTMTEGVWALDGGGNTFLWRFTGGPEGVPGCSVYDMMGGKLFMETPCDTAALEGTQLSLAMPNGVRYEGKLDLSAGQIRGALLYPDGNRREAELRWSPRERYPSLDARPPGDSVYQYAEPVAREDGLAVAHAQEVDVDPAALEAMVQAVIRGHAGILKSLLVVRGGKLILEEYFHDYGPDDLFPIQSCTKSISSLLIGIAIQEGAISDPYVSLLDFFPSLRGDAGAGWDALTLHHLLTMSLALDWSPSEAQELHGTGPAAFRQILQRNVMGRPGTDFEYVNMNVNLLAGILHEATGEFPEAFADRTLFRPLGIDWWNWDYGKVEGFNLMDGSLRLRPRDMAKIGLMMSRNGRWKGVQVVSEDWVRRSLDAHISASQNGEEYGYLWWRMAFPGPHGEAVKVAFANGWGSQFILLFPDLDMVVVTTGGNQENGKHLALGSVLVRDLLPGVTATLPGPALIPGTSAY